MAAVPIQGAEDWSAAPADDWASTAPPAAAAVHTGAVGTEAAPAPAAPVVPSNEWGGGAHEEWN